MRQPHSGTVTAVEVQAKLRRHLGRRVNVFVDDKFSFALDGSLAARRGLEPGRELSSEEVSELLHEDGDARALARAFHFLSYRPRSEREVREKLAADEWPPEVIERTLQTLREGKMLDDARFAADYVEGRSLSKPRGARALKWELSRKGVARETVEAALPGADEEVENAVVALQKVARRFEKFEPGREREGKQIEFLARRGFGYSTARAALKQLAAEDEL